MFGAALPFADQVSGDAHAVRGLRVFWLQREIAGFRRHDAPALFENAGKGSYSIYLVHLLGPALYVFWALPQFSAAPLWAAQLAFTFVLCWIFYLLVERPSHQLARSVADKLSRKPDPAQVA